MKRTFIEFAAVSRVLRNEGVLDDALRDLQREIMQDKGDRISGTGGLRKIRCGVEGRGKSGGVRIIYADYPESGLCLLIAAFAKNVQENLSRAKRNELSKLKAALDKTIGHEKWRKGK